MQCQGSDAPPTHTTTTPRKIPPHQPRQRQQPPRFLVAPQPVRLFRLRLRLARPTRRQQPSRLRQRPRAAGPPARTAATGRPCSGGTAAPASFSALHTGQRIALTRPPGRTGCRPARCTPPSAGPTGDRSGPCAPASISRSTSARSSGCTRSSSRSAFSSSARACTVSRWPSRGPGTSSGSSPPAPPASSVLRRRPRPRRPRRRSSHSRSRRSRAVVALLALEAGQGVLDGHLLLQSGGLLAGRHLQHAVEVQVELHDDLVAGRHRRQALRSGSGRRDGCGARRRSRPGRRRSRPRSGGRGRCGTPRCARPAAACCGG